MTDEDKELPRSRRRTELPEVKPRKGPLQPVDLSVLSEAEKADIAQQAERVVAAETKSKAKKVLLDQEIEKARKKTDPAEEMVEFTIDLAPHSDRITLDGKIFFHGQYIRVSRKVAETLREVIARGWDHQAEIDGKSSNAYRRAKSIVLNPQKLGASNEQLMRV